MSGRVALTGATGFLGRRLAPALAAAGFAVRALARRPPLSDDAGPEWVKGDLADPAALNALLDGADVVVHAAGLIKARSAAEFAAVNVDGARRIAALASPRPFILVSSLAAREPSLSDYAASKAAGEAAVRAAHPSAVIVRPPALYGPGDRETLGLFRAARSAPVMILPGPADARLALAEVDDVAAVIVALARDPRPGAAVVVGGHKPAGYAWTEIVGAACAAFGRRVPLIPIPSAVVRFAGRASESLAKASGQPTIFTLGKAREILHRDWSVSDVEQGEFADFPYRALHEGFVRTIEWYRLHGWIR